MEAIILLVISSIIGYFLKNKDEETTTPPPVIRRVQRSDSKKIEQTVRQKVDEVSKNVLQDLDRKLPKAGELRKNVTEVIHERKQPVEGNVFERPQRELIDRSNIIQKVKTQPAPQQNDKPVNGFKFPQNSSELAQAIVMAEILGPPKSKR